MRVVERGLKILHEEGIEKFIKKASLYVFGKSVESYLGYIFIPFIVRKFRSSVRNIDDIYNALALCSLFKPLECQ